MAANTDHLRRDAEAAARSEIALVLGKYQRRIYEDAKTHIGRAITDASPGEAIDGTDLGREAVALGAASYLGGDIGNPQPAIEAESGSDSDN